MRIIDADTIKIPNFRLASYKIRMRDAIGDAPTITTKEIKYFDDDEHVWKIGRVIVDE